MVRIAGIEAGSIADELHLEIGTRIVRINGERVRDGIDFTFLSAETELALETVSPSGDQELLQVRLDDGESLGVIPAPDKVRECANECVFCFIDGNPEGVRSSLWLRDDDFRLSFTYGSYVTLTNLGQRGLQRLVDQRISPLYISVHATEPDVRVRLLKNERAGEIMDQLRYLLGHGLEAHTQVVLCPGWNDGPHLDRTMTDLYSLGEGIRSLSVVPVGLTRYNIHRPVRPLRPGEATTAIDQVDAFRSRALRERDQGWVYSADELYLHAGRPLPSAAYYDSWDLTENGVGSVVRFQEAFNRDQHGIPDLSGRSIRIMTGTSMAPFLRDLAPLVEEGSGAQVQIHPVRNRFFGESVTVAGLLAGRDLLEALPESTSEDVVLIPQDALNADELFIDSMSLTEFREAAAPAVVRPGLDLVETLKRL